MNKKLRFVLPALALGILTLAACGASLSEEVEDEPTPRPPAAFGIEADPTRVPGAGAIASPTPPTGATQALTGNGLVDRDPNYEAALQEARLNTRGWDTDFSLHTISFDDITQVITRDGIPAIDNPKFITPEEAEAWLGEVEPVIALEINGESKAYPLQILTWHEIVNDVVGGVSVAVTFCPLCNSAIVFDSRMNEAVLSFGVSGNLRNSDLIMYDRETHTWWQQFTGEGIVGTFAGEQLDIFPAAIISFADFRAANPEGEILSRDTGFSRAYGQNPYAGYDRADRPPFLFSGDTDGRLLPKDRVVAVTIGDVDAAFPLTILEEEKVINYEVNGQDLAIFFTLGTTSALDASSIKLSRDVGATGVFDPNLDGQKLTFRADGDSIMDNETGSVWNILGQAIEGPLAGKELTRIVHADHFWFAWAAFKPDTIIYQNMG
ncbi:MAG: DUF3179 domain-containing protein [Chloroflexi bacterium]|nr:DUF3179 domain-containing protein [Chloroflexota bacterium]